MKKLTLGALIILTVFTLGCKKDQTETPTTTSGAGATVTAGNYGFDGSASLGKFSSTKAGIVQLTANGVTTFTLTAIKDGSNQSITIILLKKAAVGKFALGPAQTNGGIIISKDYTKASDGTLNYSTDKSGTMQGGGEVNITKLDGSTVEGSFYAIAYNSSGKEAFVEQGTFLGKIQ
ncbi:DUF6252 family protein [Mucilaginibacter myungsuensis]|uniref:Lipoprotein n=1 Tax=Mucilaginibacter myungsuensis TaxID=649104 RepID=A0A929KRZ8_9SPHI|nr:DUF6252 family protein [Mucilaginibacter myungsuensis]MBE9660416.1 hypothetical protein [Mucilaginibacter myungsuensis]MDN3600458.1 DUF6252 family protein [Mucilaginibacter myungsuensis]